MHQNGKTDSCLEKRIDGLKMPEKSSTWTGAKW